MKKKFFGAVVVVTIAIGAMVNVNLNHLNKHSALTFESIESLAGENQACLSEPGKNIGKCEARTSGYGYDCVRCWEGEQPDCIAVIYVD